MNQDQLKDFISYLSLVGYVVTWWCLTQDVAGSKIFFFYKNDDSEFKTLKHFKETFDFQPAQHLSFTINLNIVKS